jgi:hypothetical protein
MWIGRGQSAMAGRFRFVHQAHNIMLQFLIDLKAQSTHLENIF